MIKDNFAQSEVDVRRSDLDDVYNIINSYDHELKFYTEVIFTSGLDKSDIKPLEKILNY